jgi:hypothetical protein
MIDYYNEMKDRVGEWCEIRHGRLLMSGARGELLISNSPKKGTLYINKSAGSLSIIPADDIPIGHQYRKGQNDCITLVLGWIDSKVGSNLLSIYLSDVGMRDRCLAEGSVECFKGNGFVDVLDMQINDLVFMKYGSRTVNHVGVYVGDGMVLHHLPGRLSGLDALDGLEIFGGMRYVGQ